MKFLITNDDGIDAPGITALARLATEFGEVVVVAPDRAHSGCGHRVTSDDPISVEERSPGRWSISGTPADCVRVGLWSIAPDADWILSGINLGANLGVDVFMSGTVAAVREGALLGCRGIAFSHYRRPSGRFDWDRAAGFARDVLGHLLDCRPTPQHFWNVNFPDLEDDHATPQLIECPLATEPLLLEYREHESGWKYCGDYHARPRSPGDDVDVCFSGNVSMTRLTVWGSSSPT
jgi:5'-nucleotidase